MFGIVLAQILKDNEPNQLTDLEGVFAKILQAAIPLAGIVLFVLLMLAGFNWISAGADPKKAESARNMATYAIIGVVALALSFLMLRVLASFTGIESILDFQVSIPQ